MYKELTTIQEVALMLASFLEHKDLTPVAIDTEYIPQRGFKPQLCGISFCGHEHDAYFIPIASILGDGEIKMLLDEFFYDYDIGKVFHNAKADLQCLWSAGFRDINAVCFDTQVAAWVCNPLKRRYALKVLAKDVLGVEMHDLKKWFKEGHTYAEYYMQFHDLAVNYACEDAFYTLKLYNYFNPLIQANFREVFHKIEMPIIPILAKMEMNGKMVNRRALMSLKDRFQTQVDDLETELRRIGTPVMREPVGR